MSLRERFGLVLGAVLIAPLLAVGVAVGVIVPDATRAYADDAAGRADGAVSVALGQRCAGLGDTATAIAAELRVLLTGARGLTDTGLQSAVDAATARRPGTTAAVLVDGRVRAVAGADAARFDGPALAAEATASCARREAAPSGPPAMAESVPVTDPGTGAELARAVAVTPLDDADLTALADGLGLDTGVALLDRRDGAAVVSATVPRSRLDDALARVAAGAVAGGADGVRFRVQRGAPGVPYDILSVEPLAGAGRRGTLLLLVAVAFVVAAALVGLLARRLTRPLELLTVAADRIGVQVHQLEASREALRRTFTTFGDALGRTHDLDGLLRTVVDAALLGADGAVACALLGGRGRLAGEHEPICAVADGAPPSLTGAFDDLAGLAGRCVHVGDLVRQEAVTDAGPALAIPLRRGGERSGELVGALAVARAPGAKTFDPDALDNVRALAGQVGTAVANVLTHQEASRLSVTDPMTGATNFRGLGVTLNREIERAVRHTRELGVLMLDLDHFKAVNDSRGHAAGDAVLRELAERLKGCLREMDLVARYGGEEFVVVLPDTDASGAAAVAQRVVRTVRETPFTTAGAPLSVTISAGAAVFPADGRNAIELLRAADDALYTAKRTGRDRWCAAGTPVDAVRTVDEPSPTGSGMPGSGAARAGRTTRRRTSG